MPYTTLKAPLLTFSLLTVLTGCGGGTSSSTSCAPACEQNAGAGANSNGANCVDTSFQGHGIQRIPDTADADIRRAFCKMILVEAPNGGTIDILAQSEISDEQLIRASRILRFYLDDVPGTTYGADKSAVANTMANNGARLLLLNGSDDGTNDPTVEGQPLYDSELVVEGTPAYLNNDYENHRDAAFEEILHLVHDYGIGTSGPMGNPGALPGYTAVIDAARENAMMHALWPTAGVDNDTLQWIEELRGEGSLSQEYLASVIDSYYGYWGADTEYPGGMMGVYIAKTRADILSQDVMGAAAVADFFNPILTYEARIDSGMAGEFTMTFDALTPYTYKSQYLINGRLTGSLDSHLTGNEHDNRLSGNAGTNTLDGKAGEDTALFTGDYAEYSVHVVGDDIVVQDSVDHRDGVTTLVNIERVVFASAVYRVEDGMLVESLPSSDLHSL